MLELVAAIGCCETSERGSNEDGYYEGLYVTWGLSDGELVDDCWCENGDAVDCDGRAAGECCAVGVINGVNWGIGRLLGLTRRRFSSRRRFA